MQPNIFAEWIGDQDREVKKADQGAQKQVTEGSGGEEGQWFKPSCFILLFS
jgi:hypothetical protein